MFRNPIVPGFNPDPSIICVGEDYFLVTSTFEFFPGIPLYHSKDLINWTLLGHVLSRPSQLNIRAVEPGTGINAPTIRQKNGRFYVAVCACHRLPWPKFDEPLLGPRGFYVWTDNIWNSNSWSDPIYFDVTGIDQDLFFDDDGKVYLSVATLITEPTLGREDKIPMGVHVCEIDLATGRSLSPLKLVRYSGVGNGVAEGSHIFKLDSFYYLITAEGGTEIEHQQWVSRSSSGPFGPWETGPVGVNPMIYNADDIGIRQTGHMDLVKDSNGLWWAVFLGVRPVFKDDSSEAQLSPLGRETFLASVEWKNGWPIVNERCRITINAVARGRDLPRLAETFSRQIKFTPATNIYKEGWYHIRTPLFTEHSLTDRPGSIALYGGPWNIRCDEAVTMLLQKQTSFSAVWELELDFNPLEVGHEAGTAAWFSKWAFASVAVRGVSGENGSVDKEIVFRHPAPTGTSFLEDCQAFHSTDSVMFRIVAEETGYTFFFGPSESGVFTEIGYLPSNLLARNRPFDAIFTGTHFSIYAMGDRSGPCRTGAFFTRVSYSGVRSGGI